MARDIKQRRQGSRCDGHLLAEADMEGRRRVADGVWMIERKEDHADHKGEVDG
jgi:hypothetical protein